MKAIAVVLVVVVCTACSTGQTTQSDDAGIDQTTDASDASGDVDRRDVGMDARIDAVAFDVTIDRGAADSREAATNQPEVGLELDAPLDSACDLGDSGFNACQCLAQPPRCSGTTCGAGRICLDTGCGMRCVRASSSCVVDDDCHQAASCSATPNDAPRCLRTVPGCGDSRDCPSGFACEDGTCHDRRIACDSAHTCPWGFVCDSVEGSQPFCRKLYPRCVSGSNCRDYELCLDVDDDGLQECAPRGTCTTTMLCRETQRVCGVDPLFRTSNCELRGVCRSDTECASGLRCLDTWGDGVRECVRVGSCQRTADCARGICGALDQGSATSCLQRP